MDLEEKTAKHTRHLLLAARLGATLAALSGFHRRRECLIFFKFEGEDSHLASDVIPLVSKFKKVSNEIGYV